MPHWFSVPTLTQCFRPAQGHSGYALKVNNGLQAAKCACEHASLMCLRNKASSMMRLDGSWSEVDVGFCLVLSSSAYHLTASVAAPGRTPKFQALKSEAPCRFMVVLMVPGGSKGSG